MKLAEVAFITVPTGCNSQQTLASLRSPGHGRYRFFPVLSASQPCPMEWVFNAAFRIDDIKAKFQNLDLICSNGSTQGAKEQASEAMSSVGGDKSTT